MIRLIAIARRFFTRQEGASLIEYALLLVLVATITVAAIASLGGSISSWFQNAANSI
jgi:Flp pilus assembly pilin Flp